MGQPIAYFKRSQVEFSLFNVFLSLKIVFISETVQTLMKCSSMLHFIWVYTVCQTTRLGVSSIQRVNIEMAKNSK